MVLNEPVESKVNCERIGLRQGKKTYGEKGLKKAAQPR